jgi:hypothetical protein
MKPFYYDSVWRRLTCLNILSSFFFALLMFTDISPTQAAAPARAKPYAEGICSTNSNVFFCEDFEGQDLVNFGSNNCGTSWGNPAIVEKDICWAGGGSHQRSTTALTGFDQATNRVWRVSKSQSSTDINTGINTGTGGGTLAGWLNPAILGSGSQEWYARIQVWFSPDHTWPADYDFKMFFALPRQFVDAPSAAYETGLYFHQDLWCNPPNANFNDVPAIRYSSSFRMFPYQNEYCPPLTPGQSPDGVHAPRIQKGRWYTLEYHVKLSSTTSGILEMWVDGVKAYSTNRVTCHNGCADMGYIMIMGWMNGADPQSGYYEIDNVIMSRSYIGPPNNQSSPPPIAQVPAAPSSLSVK